MLVGTSFSESTTLGERIGVARGSVSLMSWMATSSSEMTLAVVGVGVGSGGGKCMSRDGFSDIWEGLRFDEDEGGGRMGGLDRVRGRFYG